ncbi:hypothetical protein JG687_00017974 [Phytophthora cactorum]|uniref:Uncharacterized protein n=2 Tax=Phytophthora cactorum TaxID=29920 RepID=A0A329RCX1_9STRA|nr:hypothetical protein JG687_00017974 [Phytophthora cactorum]RAW22364.1 hypothetical protein PC110_g21194 [Phytophthora cactorum]
MQVQAESHSGWTTEDCKHEAEQRFAARREEVNANSILAFERRGKASSKPRSKAERFSLSDCYKTLKKSTRFMRSIAMLRKRQLAAGELTLNSESEEYELNSSDVASATIGTPGESVDSPVPATQDTNHPFTRPGGGGKSVRSLPM